jgi:hypothetical protein
MLYVMQFLWQMNGINFVFISIEYSVPYDKLWFKTI